MVSNGIKMVTVSGKLFLNATYVMITQGNEVMAYWSYRHCTLLILKSQNSMVLKVRNLCPFLINAPITVKIKNNNKTDVSEEVHRGEYNYANVPKMLE